MNRLEDLISAAFEEDARHAPGAGPVVTRVLDAEKRRRRWTARRGWLATAAVAATIVTIGVIRIGDGGNGNESPAVGPPLPHVTGLTGSGDFTERKVSYAEGSTIYYGDQTVNVSPHQVRIYVQTDDGFVIADRKGAVYFTDGTAISRIGRGASDLTADDSGSYVGWTNDTAGTVVYDTAKGRKVLRDRLGDAPGYLAAIDGATAFLVSKYADQAAGTPWIHRSDAWNLTTGTSTSVPQVKRGFLLHDAANGYRVWTNPDVDDPNDSATIVNRGPGVDQRRYPGEIPSSSNALSPDGSYVATLELATRIIDRATGRDVTPSTDSLNGAVVQWLDRDRFVYDRIGDGDSQATIRHELLTCSAAAGTCSVAAEQVGPIVYPDGYFR